MKSAWGSLARAYAVVTAYAVALAAVIAVVLFGTGAVTWDRMTEALHVLRTPKTPTAERAAVLSDDERLALERAQRQRKENLDAREKDLGKLEIRLAGELAKVRQEEAALESARARVAEEQARLKKDQDSAAAVQAEAEVAANVPIFSKMDGPGIVALMKEWDDARFVRYLRAMRPTKAAEVLDTVRTDPQFEPEFRRLPEDAPPGSKTRAERLADEFKKAP